ncbi:MAG: phenylalanine--tRNA ligase subunit alpha, partial [Rhodospirillales bacterium]
MDTLKSLTLAEIGQASNLEALEAVRVKALGKKGALTEEMKKLGGMSPDERKAFGARINEVKGALETALAARKAELEGAAIDARLSAEKIDITLPARPELEGRIHPISQTIDEVTAIFAEMGFAVAEGPDIEDDFHNFTALNFPPDHPARQMHDTFFFGEHAPGERML